MNNVKYHRNVNVYVCLRLYLKETYQVVFVGPNYCLLLTYRIVSIEMCNKKNNSLQEILIFFY